MENIDAGAYTAQAQQIADAASQQISAMQTRFNGTSGALNEAANGLKTGAENTLSAKSGDMKAGAAKMTEGAQSMEAGIQNIPEIPSDPISQVTSAVGQLYTGAQKVDAGVDSVSEALGTLETGTKDFPKAAAGVKALNEGFSQLTANDDALVSGAESLKAAGSTVAREDKPAYSRRKKLQPV